MPRYLVAAIAILVCYVALLAPMSQVMQKKSYVEKLGLVPNHRVLKTLLPDYQEILAASIIGKVILYYGALTSQVDDAGRVIYAADYPAMSRTIHTALYLDPYNMDGYYFGQAILAWDVRQYRLATELLEYGMQYRTWDWQLPFFAGFNYAYFLNDKENAARMYLRAAELSGAPLFSKLAGRYLQETGQTRMAVDYLQTLAKSTRNPAVKSSLEVRVAAFQAVLAIEKARDFFLAEKSRMPGDLAELVTTGFLEKVPEDPYGGQFYFDENCNVRTTSRFAFASRAADGGPAN